MARTDVSSLLYSQLEILASVAISGKIPDNIAKEVIERMVEDDLIIKHLEYRTTPVWLTRPKGRKMLTDVAAYLNKAVVNSLICQRFVSDMQQRTPTSPFPRDLPKLTAALDVSGSVVLINDEGDIVFYAADGKMRVERTGRECDACTARNMRLAEAVADAWNNTRDDS